MISQNTTVEYLYTNGDPVNRIDLSGYQSSLAEEQFNQLVLLSLVVLTGLTLLTILAQSNAARRIDFSTTPDTTDRVDNSKNPNSNPKPRDPIDFVTPFPIPDPITVQKERLRRRIPKTPGVYYLNNELPLKKYVGSSVDMLGRLIDLDHTKAWDVMSEPQHELSIWPVVFLIKEPVTRREWNRALRSVEQEILDLKGFRQPNINGWLNRGVAATRDNQAWWKAEFGATLLPEQKIY